MASALDDFVNQGMAQVGGWNPDPGSWGPIVAVASAQYKVPPSVLWGLIQTESGGRASAVSSAGAKGPVQLMDPTAQSLGAGNSFDPREAIPAAAKLLRQTLNSNGGDLTNALQQYQGGPDTSKWGPQNAAYPGQVLGAAQAWQKAQGAAQGAGQPVAPADSALAGFIQNGQQAVTATIPAGLRSPGPQAAVPASPLSAPVAASPEAVVAQTDAPATSSTPTIQAPPSTAASPAQVQQNLRYANQLLTAPSLTAQTSANTPLQGPWSEGQDLLHYGTLGLSDPVIAAGQAGIQSLTQGAPFGTAYQANRSQQDLARAQWEKENPGQALGNAVLGPVPGTSLGVGALGRVAGAGVGAVADALPTIGPGLQSAADFLSGSGGTGSLLRGASRAAGGALQGVSGAALDSGLDPSSQVTGSNMLRSAGMGVLAGPAFGALGDILAPKINPQVAQTAQWAAQNGVGIPLGNLAPKSVLGNMAEGPSAETYQNLTRLASKQIGLDQPTLTSADIQGAKRSAGADMNTALAQSTLPVDNQFLNGTGTIANALSPGGHELGLHGIQAAANQLLPGTAAEAPVQRALTGVYAAAASPTGQISGKDYQGLVGKSNLVGNLLNNSDSNQQYFGGLMKQLLDTTAARGAPAGVQEALQDAKQRYAIASNLEPAAANAGGTGVLNPTDVKNAFKNAPPTGTTKQIANVAQLLGSSGPTGQTRGGAAGSGLGSTISSLAAKAAPFAIGAVPGSIEGGNLGGLVGGLAAASVPYLAGQVASTDAVRNMLLRNSLGQGAGPYLGALYNQLPLAANTAVNRLYTPMGQSQ